MEKRSRAMPADSDSSRPARALPRRALFTRRRSPAEPTADYWIRVFRRAMACRFEVTLSGEDARHIPAARAALDEVDRLEALLTVFRDTSALSDLNRRAALEDARADGELFDLLVRCRALHAETEGAFDPTSTPLSRCWGFLRREARRPAPEEIEAARVCVGMDGAALDLERRTVRFDRAGLELNLGAIGKGYALDRAAAHLRAGGVAHALLSAAGSSVVAVGDGRDPRGFWIDVGSRRLERPVARLRLRDGAVGTSGAGEQFFEVEGRRYGHVIDPRTGWPAEGVLSATVVAGDAALADALSTAFLVGGAGLAERVVAARAGVLAILTLEGEPRPRVLGSYPGAILEELCT
jgi:FAD:protein FMN transferase